jgi:hypothetical protein
MKILTKLTYEKIIPNPIEHPEMTAKNCIHIIANTKCESNNLEITIGNDSENIFWVNTIDYLKYLVLNDSNVQTILKESGFKTISIRPEHTPDATEIIWTNN